MKRRFFVSPPKLENQGRVTKIYPTEQTELKTSVLIVDLSRLETILRNPDLQEFIEAQLGAVPLDILNWLSSSRYNRIQTISDQNGQRIGVKGQDFIVDPNGRQIELSLHRYFHSTEILTNSLIANCGSAYEVYYVTYGNCIFRVWNDAKYYSTTCTEYSETVLLEPGSLVLIPSNAICHITRIPEETGSEFINIHCLPATKIDEE